jgi:DNA-binding FadR family transcriptional regulator
MKTVTIVTFWTREYHARLLRALSAGDTAGAHIALREYHRNLEGLVGA